MTAEEIVASLREEVARLGDDPSEWENDACWEIAHRVKELLEAHPPAIDSMSTWTIRQLKGNGEWLPMKMDTSREAAVAHFEQCRGRVTTWQLIRRDTATYVEDED